MEDALVADKDLQERKERATLHPTIEPTRGTHHRMIRRYTNFQEAR